MKKLKDIFYDKNDILVAFAIVAVAALVIVTRIDAILAYPSTLSAETSTPIEEPVVYTGNGNQENTDGNTEDDTDTFGNDQEENPDQQTPEDNNTEGNNNEGNTTGDNNTAGSNVVNHTVHIESGSTGEQIAEILLSKGLIKSKQEFYSAVTAAGADTKLKAGDFTIPSDSTPAEVIAIITR